MLNVLRLAIPLILSLILLSNVSAQDDVSGLIEQLKTTLNALQTPTQTRSRDTDWQSIADLQYQLTNIDAQTQQLFIEQLQTLQQQSLSEAQQRHHTTVTQYQQQINELFAQLNQAQATQNAQSALDYLQQHYPSDDQPRFDPDHLPFSLTQPIQRQPYTTAEELAQLASTANLRKKAPSDADLQASEDIQISAEIQALAASLDNNPVKIYNWVHDNIDYIPTYGSIQGSQLTYIQRYGNAFDTSSLLLALFRAAGIQSHYVYGTVQIPIDKLINWLKVTTANEATDLLGKGYIPHTAITQSGQIIAVQLEHIWVEAWLDYHPSRAAIHREGDTWVPLDPSFKHPCHQPRRNRPLRQRRPHQLPPAQQPNRRTRWHDHHWQRLHGTDARQLPKPHRTIHNRQQHRPPNPQHPTPHST